MKAILRMGLLGALVTLLPAVAHTQTSPANTQPQWEFTTKDHAITIVKYNGPGGAVLVPGTLNGLPVTTIGDKAFFQCTNLTRATIPASVKNIGDYAFGACPKLKGVYFKNGAPDFGSSVFYRNDQVTVYYLRGTSGWLKECCDRPTAQWDADDQDNAAGGRPAD